MLAVLSVEYVTSVFVLVVIFHGLGSAHVYFFPFALLFDVVRVARLADLG